MTNRNIDRVDPVDLAAAYGVGASGCDRAPRVEGSSGESVQEVSVSPQPLVTQSQITHARLATVYTLEGMPVPEGVTPGSFMGS